MNALNELIFLGAKEARLFEADSALKRRPGPRRKCCCTQYV